MFDLRKCAVPFFVVVRNKKYTVTCGKNSSFEFEFANYVHCMDLRLPCSDLCFNVLVYAYWQHLLQIKSVP